MKHQTEKQRQTEVEGVKFLKLFQELWDTGLSKKAIPLLEKVKGKRIERIKQKARGSHFLLGF